MMKVKTKHFGEMEIAEERIISFSDGLLGFEQQRRYFLLDAPQNDSFHWLQCIDNPELCFLVTEPVSFMFEYSLELTDGVVEELQIQLPEEVLILALVTVPADPAKISANLCGPLVINSRNRQGKQIVSVDPKHQIKHYIIEEMQKNSARLAAVSSAATAEKDGKEVGHAGSDAKI